MALAVSAEPAAANTFFTDPALCDRAAALVGPCAAAVDSGEQSLRDGLAALQRELLAGAGGDAGPNTDLALVSETIAAAAGGCMTTAFALWCQRMVLEYLAHAPANSPLRTNVLPRVEHTELLGSTALAAAMAHYVGGAPLTVTWREEGDGLVLDGRVTWASNMAPPDFVMVTAAAHAETGREIMVALPGDAPGLEIAPYPHLLALQATASSSAALRGVRVPRDWLVSDDFGGFIGAVRPVFLLLQSSFCFGLSAKALAEAAAVLRPATNWNAVLQPDLDELERRLAQFGATLRRWLPSRGHDATSREVVQLRLDLAQLTTAAVALEAKAIGGRGYVATSGTARRFREAAFLPIQAPTEGQLRWELSRSA